jgi:hydrogenase/urease accessory protein HupE
MKRLVLVVALLATFAPPAWAHDFRPALLAITQQKAGDYQVVWRIPLEAGEDRLTPLLPAGTTRQGESQRSREGDSLVERFRVVRPQGFGGGVFRLGGQSPLINEVLVRVEEGGRVSTGRFPRGGSFELPRVPTSGAVALTYLRLGVEHIATGLDHLCFVLALVLLATSTGAILRAVTAFTAAHSLTLAAAALGYTHVPQAPVEASIALSIVFVARELMLRRRGGPAARTRPPTGVAFAFGLLHGLGFAGALAEVGLPRGDIPLALLCFNGGVELGQLAFVALVLLVRSGLRPLLAAGARQGATVAELCHLLAATPATAIGAVGAYWLIARVVAFFG